jgi:hypothetical protein
VGELRRVVQHLSAGFLLQDGADKWVKRSLLAKEIKKKLGLKTEKKEKSAAAKVKMNLHRLNQLLWYCYFRWDGKERWRGGHIRAKVVRLCKNKFKKAKTDDEAIAMACDCSGLFCGLFRLLDVEIRLAVEPFMLWEQGDFRPFLRAMPSMCALIASGYKPKVSKVVLMALERMAGYLRDHPELVDHMAVNCTLFDEEKIEFLNAKIGRWFNARTPNSGIEQYTKVTSIMKGVEEIQRSLDELLIKRKTQATENERLRTAYLSPSWTETHEKFEAFVLGRFEAALNEAKPAAEAEDRFAAGLVKIDDKYLPELLTWARAQRTLRGGGGGGI